MSADIPNQRRGLPLLASQETCAGGTYIVTGSNTGLGYEAAKHLVSLDAARVILAVRNTAAGEAAKARIENETDRKQIAEVWPLDLARYPSVKAFAERALNELSRIDAVIENAAVATSHRTLSEGHITPVTVNVLSTFLLAILLLPRMMETAQQLGINPHLVFVTSRVGFDSKEDWHEIRDAPIAKMDIEESFSMKSYPLSKLLVTLGARELARILPVSRTGVVINHVCPGVCRTELGRNAPDAFRQHLEELYAQFGRTAEDGSRTLLHGAVAGKASHGCLLDSCEIGETKVPDWVTDEEGQKYQRVAWDEIVEELGKAGAGSALRFLENGP